MAIVPLKKVSLFGMTDRKQAVLEDLQRLGCTHLVNLTPGTGDGRPERGYSVESHEAFQYLVSCPDQRKPAVDQENFDFGAVEQEALEIRQKEQELSDERDALVKAIQKTQPWGEFRLPPWNDHPELTFWFYAIPHYRTEKFLEESELVCKPVGRDERFDYVIIVAPEEPQDVPGTRVKLDPRPLSELTRRRTTIDRELEDLHWKRAELTRWCPQMALEMARADDRAALEHACEQTLDESRVFAIQGWVPAKAIPEIESFSTQRSLALLIEDPGPEDEPPTLLDNPEVLAGGEGTVTFYMTPAYSMWDPSIIVFFSFAIFFGMIFSDAGYALLLAIVLGLSWKKLSASKEAIRMRNLFAALVIASAVYGVMVNSYFGVTLSKATLFGRLQVFDSQNQGGMMRLSIIVGVAHIMLANFVTAWRLRGSLCSLASIGWAAMTLGGLLFGMKVVGDDAFAVCLAAGYDPPRRRCLGGPPVHVHAAANAKRQRHWIASGRRRDETHEHLGRLRRRSELPSFVRARPGQRQTGTDVQRDRRRRERIAPRSRIARGDSHFDSRTRTQFHAGDHRRRGSRITFELYRIF